MIAGLIAGLIVGWIAWLIALVIVWAGHAGWFASYDARCIAWPSARLTAIRTATAIALDSARNAAPDAVCFAWLSDSSFALHVGSTMRFTMLVTILSTVLLAILFTLQCQFLIYELPIAIP